jgi:NitT/TauT family transport system permease protein
MTRSRLFLAAAALIGIAAWEIVGRLNVTFIVPPFTEVLAAGTKVWTSQRFLGSLAGSLTSLAVGFGMAVAGGVILGVLMGMFDRVSWACELYVNTLMSSPKAALVPIIVLLFGFGSTAVIVTVLLYAFFPVVVNTAAGVRQTPKPMLEMARSFGASRTQMARRVVLPAAGPLVFGGIRSAAARSVKGVIMGEQLIAVIGIGALIQRYGVQFQFPELYSIVLVVAIAGLGLSGFFGWVQRRAMPWIPRQIANGVGE